MKRCFKCNETLSLSQFYRHPQMGDGHLGKCKECTKRDVRERRLVVIATPAGLEAERKRGREKYWRLYAPEEPKVFVTPDQPIEVKARARRQLWNAIKTGKVMQQPCEVCGRKGQAHHEDYSKPLDVRWLCSTHHHAAHRIPTPRPRPASTAAPEIIAA